MSHYNTKLQRDRSAECRRVCKPVWIRQPNTYICMHYACLGDSGTAVPDWTALFLSAPLYNIVSWECAMVFRILNDKLNVSHSFPNYDQISNKEIENKVTNSINAFFSMLNAFSSLGFENFAMIVMFMKVVHTKIELTGPCVNQSAFVGFRSAFKIDKSCERYM